MTGSASPLLIRHATLLDGRRCDVLLREGRIFAIGAIPSAPGMLLDAGGGLLLPGLHDHHIHVAALAAASSSIRCGPPEVSDAVSLSGRLAAPGKGWLRGTGYHESVAGMIDRHWLDRVAGVRPIRVQHRGGRMWVFNTPGLERLLASGLEPPAGLERDAEGWTGRLFDEDAWLRRALGGRPPTFGAVGAQLARFGVTGITDLTPNNDDAIAVHFAEQHRAGVLPQRVVLAGRPDLGSAMLPADVALGPVKLHLHEAHLPNYEGTVALVRQAHDAGRGVAVHCVTRTELVFTLSALRDAGVRAGDRIEHASIATDAEVSEMRALGVCAVVQPHFVAERGDAYLRDVESCERPYLYRLRAFERAGVAMAGGSDAPFGDADPWRAMAAAVSRRTAGGRTVGPREALSPEAALSLFLADPLDLRRTRRIEAGAPADLCLLFCDWARAREQLSSDLVRATIIAGRIVHDRVHQAPAERGVGADAAS